MGDYAASGGYFIALPADKIVAEPLTITGSIGVLGGKMVLANLWGKIGAHWENIKFGDHAGILSPNHKFNAGEKKAFDHSLDNIYQDFTSQVSDARHISLSKLDTLARGRVWLGEQAVQNGLVDELGTIEDAIARAKELAGLTSTQQFRFQIYPRPKSFMEKLGEFIHQSPRVSINQLASKIGLDIKDINVLQHLQYDCIIFPFIVYK